MNASRIAFPDCEQTFLAAQAPKPESFDQFWHMVIQEKVSINILSKEHTTIFLLIDQEKSFTNTFTQVSVIVMITKLAEKNRRKAHQYWPDPSGEESLGVELDIGGGCKVEHLSTSFQGSFFQRQVKIASNPFPGSFYCTTCLVGTVGRLFSSTPTIGLILLRPKNQGGEIIGILTSTRVEKIQILSGCSWILYTRPTNCKQHKVMKAMII